MANTHLKSFIAAARAYHYRTKSLTDFVQEVTNACLLEKDLIKQERIEGLRAINNKAYWGAKQNGHNDPNAEVAKTFIDKVLLAPDNVVADLAFAASELFTRSVAQHLISDVYQRSLVADITQQLSERRAQLGLA